MTERDGSALLRAGLRDLEKESVARRGLRLFALSELAEAVSEEAKASLLREGTPAQMLLTKAEDVGQGTPAVYRPLLEARGEDAHASDLLALAVFLAERIAKEIDPVTAFRASRPGDCRICYVPSARAEAAYAVCLNNGDNVSLLLADNAELGCAALAAGDADYLLLPYAGASGARLVSTERLVERYDLYTAATVRLREEEGEVTYGLFSAYSAPFAEREEMLLSLRFTAESHSHLGRMLTAFDALGFTVRELVSLPEDYGRVKVRAVLEGKGNYTALWLYLSLYAGSFSFGGLFPVLEQDNGI